MKLRFALVVALAAWAPHAWAADGDEWAAASYVSRDEAVQAYKLCDTKTAVATSCAVLDTAAGQSAVGSYATFWLESATGCSGAYAVTISGGMVSGGSTSTVVVLDASTTAYVTAKSAPRYLSASVGTATDCTNVTVGVQMHHPRNHQ